MTPSLIACTDPVTLIGAGPVQSAEIIEAHKFAPEVIAADGGANAPIPAEVTLRAVVGDMDSVSDPAALAARGVRLLEVSEQNSTDLQKCLYSIDAPGFIGVGFLGGRADHALAAVNALSRYRDKPVILLSAEDVCFLCPDILEIDLPEGARVSLFPLAPVRGTLSEGLRWSVEGMEMAPDGQIGVSNMAVGGPLRIGFDRRRVVTILPAEHLPEVVHALF